MPTDLTVPQTIASQIGGKAFYMMGTRQGELIGSERNLSFRIRGSQRVTHVSITLNPLDLYDIEFLYCRNHQRKVVEKAEDIYFDSLHDCIQRVTGLYLSL